MEPMPCLIDQQQLAQDHVEAARTDGVDLIGPDGLLTGLAKTVLETGEPTLWRHGVSLEASVAAQTSTSCN
jgi:hypothetical protein